MKDRIISMILMLIVTTCAWAQSSQVSGVVVDSQGVPFPGASVIVVGTTQGTVTDLDGNFMLKVDNAKSQSLTISCIGFKSVTLSLAEKTTGLQVKLEEESIGLDEVVAVGYGTVTKRDLTGSVASIKAKDIAAVPVSSASEALTGKMAGVNVSTTEGSPDADVKIRVRGGGSLSQDNSPLYIVDGFPVASISDIAPSEIESIDVLKDASSTAIYGARGANGVIIVTTKSGKEGKTQVNINGSYGLKQVTKLVKVLSPYEYAMYQYETESATQSVANYSSSYGNFDDLEIWKSAKGTDYQDEIFGRMGSQLQMNANISGGSKEMQYNVSYAHNQEESIMVGSGYSKDNVNAKLKLNINKWLTLDFQARMAYQKVKGLSGGADTNESSAANSIVANSVRFRPISQLSGDDDDEENSTSTQYSPLERLNDTYKQQNRFRQDYNSSLSWKPTKSITVRSEFGYGWKKNKTDQVWATKATQNSKFGYSGAPQAYFITDNTSTWRNANTVTYDNKKLFDKRDKISVVLGHEWNSSRQVQRTNTSVSYPSTMTIKEILANLGAGTALPNSSNIKAEDNMLSFFGRVNYTMMDKYLATVTVRADGSSKFADGNRWGVFPSVALAWRLSDEEFMESYKEWLQNLKVRLSFGTAGNNRINSGLTMTTYSMSGNTGKAPFFNENRGSMLEHGSYLYNPSLKWETTTTRNVGLDFGFFDGKISGTVDAYWNTTTDLLMKATIPSNTGYEYQYQNFGQTSNKGLELQLNAVVLDNTDYSLSFNFNIGYNTNNIDELNTDNPWQTSKFAGSTITYGDGDYRIEEGGRLGEVWGYKSNGFYTVYDAQSGKGDLILNGGKWTLANDKKDNSYTLVGGTLYPGLPKFEVDENGDPVRQRLGNTVAKINGGFGAEGRVKGFDYSIFFNYSLGNEIINGTKLCCSFMAGSARGYNIVNDYNLDHRYTWVDPETGWNLGRPSTDAIAAYGGEQGVMDRLNQLNANATEYSPVAATKMVMTSKALENASFLRLNNITVGYTLPKAISQKWLIESLRVYATGYNLYCFTKYSGCDPEVDTNSNPMCPGIDYASYPKSRSFVAGINITF